MDVSRVVCGSRRRFCAITNLPSVSILCHLKKMYGDLLSLQRGGHDLTRALYYAKSIFLCHFLGSFKSTFAKAQNRSEGRE